MTGASGGAVRRGPLAFILLTVLLDTMGFGLIIPVLPTLVTELGGVDLSAAAGVGGLLVMAYALAQFVFSPVLGGLSDAFGRRPVLLASMAGFAVNMLIVAAATQLWMLFVGRVLAGITGASIATANAYIADITPPERRAQNFGLLGVAFGLGFILGPAAGGLLGAIDSRAPFVAAAALAGLNMLMGLFLLPESLTEDRRRPFDWRRANPIGSLKQLGRLGGRLRGFAIVYFLWMLAIQSLHGIWSYVTAYRYQWSPLEIGLSLTTVGVLAVVVNGVLVKRIVARVGEWRTAVVGITAGTLSYLVYLVAEAPALAYLGLFVGALGGVTVPALQALMTRAAGSDAQGELQGALATLSALTIISGPLVFARIFTLFSGPDAPVHAPGAPFLLSALLAGAALLMLRGMKPAPAPAA